LNVAVPALFNVSPKRYWDVDAGAIRVPLLLKIPCGPVVATQLPLESVVHIVPPLHVSSPLRFIVSVPARVPVSVNAVSGTGLPVTKLSVPLMVTGTVKALGYVRFTTPETNSSVPVPLNVPPIFAVVPPESCSVAPLAVLHDPGPDEFPRFGILNVPELACTDPVLVKVVGAIVLVAVPEICANVPALLNAPPPLAVVRLL
jgi:hypothetical protein